MKSVTSPPLLIIMAGRLPGDAVNRIVVRFKNNKEEPAIQKATKVAYSTIYRIRLNLDPWSTPYPPPTIILGRPRGFLQY
jgi:hypothetical protein